MIYFTTLFIYHNRFNRNDKKLMYQNQMMRNYAFQELVNAKLTEDAKELVALQLEPDALKRPTIIQICQHGWFPIVLMESEIAALSTSSKSNAEQE